MGLKIYKMSKYFQLLYSSFCWLFDECFLWFVFEIKEIKKDFCFKLELNSQAQPMKNRKKFGL